MNLDDIKKHWTDLAVKYQQEINATTKTVTIKKLEIKAIYDAIIETGLSGGEILEVGTGNGVNCFALAEQLPKFKFTGVDYVPEMVDSANTLKSQEGSRFASVSFYEGNILALEESRNLKEQYDIVFTDRCIINMNTQALQETALANLMKKVKKGGFMIILENIKENHSRQNDCREAVGLPRREVPPYNLFMNESSLLSFVSKSMTLKKTNDFGSLHDLLLYVFVPMTNGGTVDYNHPIVEAATTFLLKSPDAKNAFGNFGQNKLYLFHKG